MAARIQNKGLDNLTAAWVAYTSTPKYIQWGTGSGQTASSTTLATANGARVLGTASQVTTSVTNDTYQVTGTITAGGSLAITEVGTFTTAGTGNPATGGDLCIYGDFSAINLASNDSIAFTIKVQFS